MDKPIGYWLKQLDQLIESAFGRAFAEQELSRRHWQVLNVLRAAPLDATALAEALRPFWEPGAIAAADVVRDLTERGWVHQDDEGRYALTPAGLAGHAEVKAQVDAVRATVIDGLTEAEYHTTMRALQQMTTNLEQAAQARCAG
jgi:DNA-binding MarR family transcriptional regulator